MFEKATRMKLRFAHKGLCSVEDLWDLSLKDLDAIFKRLNAQSKVQSEESLLDTKTVEDEELDLKIKVVRHVFGIKMQEKKDRENAAERKAKKEKLMAIIAKKQDEHLESLDLDALTKMVNDL